MTSMLHTPSKGWKRIRHTIAALVLLFLVFTYGYLSHRNNLPPSGLITQLYHHFQNQEQPALSHSRPGRWNTLERNTAHTALSQEQLQEMEKLLSIGYLGGSRPVPSRSGVLLYDKASAYNGFNFYTSGHAPEAILMDMEGKVLHKWQYDMKRIWPYKNAHWQGTDPREFWRRAHLFENGDLCAICEGVGLVKLDKNSRLLWSYGGGAHHDLSVAQDGRIFVLTREPRMIERINKDRPILEDFVTVLDPNGEPQKQVSILEAFENSAYAPLLERMNKYGDVFHTNTIKILDGSLEKKSPLFKRGNVLVSLRELDVIAIIDLDVSRVVWSISGMWRKQHEPKLLGNGRMILFDNLGNRGRSKVIEFDPFTQYVAWTYGLGKAENIFSSTCGSEQRLKNGNTLITESDAGRALEVTSSNRIVWEYVNPSQVREGNNEFIATIFDLVRVPPEFPMDWLETAGLAEK